MVRDKLKVTAASVNWVETKLCALLSRPQNEECNLEIV